MKKTLMQVCALSMLTLTVGVSIAMNKNNNSDNANKTDPALKKPVKVTHAPTSDKKQFTVIPGGSSRWAAHIISRSIKKPILKP